MKQIFSHSETSNGETHYKFYLGVDETKDEREQLEKVKKYIDVYLEDNPIVQQEGNA